MKSRGPEHSGMTGRGDPSQEETGGNWGETARRRQIGEIWPLTRLKGDGELELFCHWKSCGTFLLNQYAIVLINKFKPKC